MKIEKFTFGMGDRFAHQGRAQLQAVIDANDRGLNVHPVWNKSNREHQIIGSKPDSVRLEANAAVESAGWDKPFYVDADHVNLSTVDPFLAGSDFFTLDVADWVGQPPEPAEVNQFLQDQKSLIGPVTIPGIEEPLEISTDDLHNAAGKFLLAIREAGNIYRHIAGQKGADSFVTEISIDETDTPQTPKELLCILKMIAAENIPVQTIAPKFTGRFNKGVDYVGDLEQFEKEFNEDLFILDYAIQQLGLPPSLKLSVHSGSDKFSLYPIIRKLITEHNCGLHVKTAGTTWLEEVIGLAEAGGGGLSVAHEIYAGAYRKFEELTAPYASVIDINRDQLPSPEDVNQWDSERFTSTLRHDASNQYYNPAFRQLIHVGFKIAAHMGPRFIEALEDHQEIVARNVTTNLLDRHILPIFPAEL